MLLDTNILIDYLNGDLAITSFFERLQMEKRLLCISVITHTEVLSLPSLDSKTAAKIQNFLSTFHTVPYDLSLSEGAAHLRRTYRLSIPDACIAATAISLGAPLGSRDGGLGTYAIFAEFMHHRGYSEKDFDLKSTEKRSSSYDAFKFQQLFTVFSPGVEQIQKGDLRLILPQAWKDYSKEDFAAFDRDYSLLYRTHSPFFFPLFTAKTLLKGHLANRESSSGLVRNPNTLQLVDYYVYEKK